MDEDSFSDVNLQRLRTHLWLCDIGFAIVNNGKHIDGRKKPLKNVVFALGPHPDPGSRTPDEYLLCLKQEADFRKVEDSIREVRSDLDEFFDGVREMRDMFTHAYSLTGWVDVRGAAQRCGKGVLFGNILRLCSDEDDSSFFFQAAKIICRHESVSVANFKAELCEDNPLIKKKVEEDSYLRTSMDRDSFSSEIDNTMQLFSDIRSFAVAHPCNLDGFLGNDNIFFNSVLAAVTHRKNVSSTLSHLSTIAEYITSCRKSAIPLKKKIEKLDCFVSALRDGESSVIDGYSRIVETMNTSFRNYVCFLVEVEIECKKACNIVRGHPSFPSDEGLRWGKHEDFEYEYHLLLKFLVDFSAMRDNVVLKLSELESSKESVKNETRDLVEPIKIMKHDLYEFHNSVRIMRSNSCTILSKLDKLTRILQEMRREMEALGVSLTLRWVQAYDKFNELYSDAENRLGVSNDVVTAFFSEICNVDEAEPSFFGKTSFPDKSFGELLMVVSNAEKEYGRLFNFVKGVVEEVTPTEEDFFPDDDTSHWMDRLDRNHNMVEEKCGTTLIKELRLASQNCLKDQ